MSFFWKKVSLLLMFAFALSSCGSETVEESSDDGVTIDVDDSFSASLAKLEFPERFQLPEVVIGRESAPITVIVYSSFTCKHCRIFHQVELPKFKKRYVDVGKVKIYLRCYLDDMGAFEAASLTRSLGKNSLSKITAAYDAIFSKQQEWLKSENPPEFLRNIFKSLGYSPKDIDAGLESLKIKAGLMKEQQRAMHEFNVISMPAFIVNGKAHQGEITCEKLAGMCGLK